MKRIRSRPKHWPSFRFKMKPEASPRRWRRGRDSAACFTNRRAQPPGWRLSIPSSWPAIFKLFGTFTVASFYAAACFNCRFLGARLLAAFLRSAAYRKSRHGRRGRMALGRVSQRHPDPLRMDLGFIALRSSGDHPALGHVSPGWTILAGGISFCYGLFWGFCLLVNPALGAVFPFLLLVDLFPTELFAAPATQSILPWSFAWQFSSAFPGPFATPFNFTGSFPIRSDFPFELWMGNNPIYDAHSRQVNRITRYEEVHRYSQLGETAYLEEKGRAAREFIRTHPALALQLAGAASGCDLGWELRRPGRTFDGPIQISCGFIFFWNALTILGVAAASSASSSLADGSCCPSPHIHLAFPFGILRDASFARLAAPLRSDPRASDGPGCHLALVANSLACKWRVIAVHFRQPSIPKIQ